MIKVKIIEHKTHKGMFYVQWPDGCLSADFYNKSRANAFRRIYQYRIDNRMPYAGPTELTGAFK